MVTPGIIPIGILVMGFIVPNQMAVTTNVLSFLLPMLGVIMIV